MIGPAPLNANDRPSLAGRDAATDITAVPNREDFLV